ncbi:MAG: ABC transporter ATP-binding protein [Actinomycetota bacterium]
MSIVFEASGLGHRYGKTWALEDCSFALPEGKVCALVGPNGAGKTTLLHCASGLLRPTTGSVSVLGRRPEQDGELLSRIGFVAQEMPLYRSFTVAEMLELGKRCNGRWDGDLARERLSRLNIPLDRKTENLSGGQRAQVALAIALAKLPELLLLDEPLASLDPLARRDFLRTLMESVAADGSTVVLSSHLVTDLERVCDYLMILTDGRIRLAGDIESLLAEHKIVTGPRRDHIAGVAEIIEQRGTERQTVALVRLEGKIFDPAWDVQDVTLEDLVLAYLGRAPSDPERRLEAVNG